MFRRALLIALIVGVTLPVGAQGPAGWRIRPDGGSAVAAASSSPTLAIAPTEKGFRLTGGPGVIFDPKNTVKPIYRVRATFTQLKAPAKKTYYGLFFGGNDMEGATPTYVYFAIAQDGSFLIRHREGDKIDDASGKSVNILEVQVAPTAVSYLVNGAVVDATPTRSAIAGNSFTVAEKIGGIVGVRSDDQIDVQVDGFFFESPFNLNDRGQ